MGFYPEYTNFNVKLSGADGEVTLEKIIIDKDTRNLSFGPAYTAKYNPTEETIEPLRTATDATEMRSTQQEAGTFLFDTFFPEEEPLGKEFRQVLKENNRVRLRLFYPPSSGDPDDPATGQVNELLDIPWEYLYFDEAGSRPNGNGFLGTYDRFSLAHCLIPLPFPQSENPLVKTLPIQAACLTPEEEDRQVFLNYFSDVQSDLVVKNRQNIIRLEEFLEAEEQDLREVFQRFHLVQYLGHGSTTSLFLDDNETALVKELEELFNDTTTIRAKVIVLCACESGDKFQSVAGFLHRAGIPVVIGMARSVSKVTARRFMETFYGQLAARACSIEEALANARNELLEYEDADSELLRLDWGLPRLYLGSEHTNLIDREQLYRPVYSNLFDRFETFRKDLLKKRGDVEGLQIAPWQQDLESWIEGHEMGILYLSGRSGSGKSTEIARLLDKYTPAARAGSPKVVYHICFDTGGDVSNHPLVFSRDSLFPQLEAVFNANLFHSWLRPEVFPLTMYKAREAFFDLVIEPIQKALRQSLLMEKIEHTVTQTFDTKNLGRVFRETLSISPGDRPGPGIGFPGLLRNSMRRSALNIWSDPLPEDTLRPTLGSALLNTVRQALLAPLYGPLLAPLSRQLYQTIMRDLPRMQFTPAEIRPIIIIDGLDNAVEWFPTYSILDVLIEFADLLTEVAHMIVAADYSEENNSAHQRILKELKPNKIVQITIDKGPQPVSSHSLSEQIGRRSFAGNTQVDEVLPHAQKLSTQAPQLMQFLESAGQDAPAILEKVGQPRPSLDAYYGAYLTLLQQHGEWSQIEKLLKVLIVAFKPLSTAKLAKFIHLNEAQLEGMASKIGGFVQQSDNVWVYEHASITRFLNKQFGLDEKKQAHDLFVRGYLSGAWDQIEAWQDWAKLLDDDYGQLYLVDHIYQGYQLAFEIYLELEDNQILAKLKERTGQFVTLISLPSFRTFRLIKGGQQAVVEDLQRALQVTLTRYALTQQNGTGPQNSKIFKQFLSTLKPLLAAYDKEFIDLMELDKKLRLNKEGPEALLRFLNLPVS